MGKSNKNEINKIHIHNDINRINTQKLKEIDLNVFFSICAMFKDLDSLSYKIPFDKFMELTKVEKNTLNTRSKFISFADKKTKKLRQLEYYNRTESALKAFNLIEGIEIPENEDVVEISITNKFSKLLHDYSGNFTEFFLTNFVEIKGKYAKNLYHLLMQWDDKGYAKYELEEFKIYMGIPEGYRTKDIKEKVIEPAIEILKEKRLFEEITFETNRAHRQGNQITGYEFNFRIAANDVMPGQSTWQQGVEEMTKFKKTKAIEKKSRNNFNNFEQNKYTKQERKELEDLLLDN